VEIKCYACNGTGPPPVHELNSAAKMGRSRKKATRERKRGNHLRTGDEIHGSRLTIVASRKVAIVRGHDRVCRRGGRPPPLGRCKVRKRWESTVASTCFGASI
jgi:hypothetical protein